MSSRNLGSLAESRVVPFNYRGKPDNCALAAAVAGALNIPLSTAMSHVWAIAGHTYLSAQFVISLAHERGPFMGCIRYKAEGKGDELSV